MVKFKAQDKLNDIELIAELPIQPESDVKNPEADKVDRLSVDALITEPNLISNPLPFNYVQKLEEPEISDDLKNYLDDQLQQYELDKQEYWL